MNLHRQGYNSVYALVGQYQFKLFRNTHKRVYICVILSVRTVRKIGGWLFPNFQS